MTVKIIAAVSQNSVIGRDQKIPWFYPEDIKFFRTMTSGANVIMGYHTYQSMGSKPLPKRHNVVVTSHPLENVEHCNNLTQAIASCPSDRAIWLLGGSNIYREGMQVANEIFLTLIPETIEGIVGVSCFPWINPNLFHVHEYLTLEGEKGLQVAHYIKK